MRGHSPAHTAVMPSRVKSSVVVQSSLIQTNSVRTRWTWGLCANTQAAVSASCWLSCNTLPVFQSSAMATGPMTASTSATPLNQTWREKYSQGAKLSVIANLRSTESCMPLSRSWVA